MQEANVGEDEAASMFEDNVTGKPLKPGPRRPARAGAYLDDGHERSSRCAPPATPVTLALNGRSPLAADGGSLIPSRRRLSGQVVH